MSTQLAIFFVLTVAIAFCIVIASATLVVHKYSNDRRRRAKAGVYKRYAAIMTELLVCDVPALPPNATAQKDLDQYEALIAPLKSALARLSPKMQKVHREVLRGVLIDFGRDLAGEAAERLDYFFSSLGYVDDELAQLDDGNWWIRAQAARDLGILRARNATDRLRGALHDPHPDVRSQALQSLVLLSGVESLRTILRAVRNISGWNAVELSTIVMQFKEGAVPYLIDAIQSPDQSVALFCIEMLAEIGFVSATEPLRSIAQDYPNINIRSKAVEALGRLGDERSEELLINLAQNPIPKLRLAAVQALGMTGSPDGIAVLAARAREGGVEELTAAVRSLAKSGDRGVAELRTLTAEDPGRFGPVVAEVAEESGIVVTEE